MARARALLPPVVLAAPLLALAAAPAQAASFATLGPSTERATAISDDGSTVVGAADTDPYNPPFGEAFVWNAEDGFRTLGTLDGGIEFSEAHAVSADGSVVVGYGDNDEGLNEGFVWREGQGYLDPIGEGRALGVSADGSVAVGSDADTFDGRGAFEWTEPYGLSLLRGGNLTDARDVSSDGSVIVGSSPSGGNTIATLWDEDAHAMSVLGELPGGMLHSSANAVSSDGTLVVGTSRSGSGLEAFLWDETTHTIEGLGDLPGGSFGSSANDISADGSTIVGDSNTETGEGGAFLWDRENGMRSLEEVLEENGVDLGDWQLTEATGVSADGQIIVGIAHSPTLGGQGFVASLGPSLAIPQPSTGLLLGTATLSLALARRRDRSGGRRPRLP